MTSPLRQHGIYRFQGREWVAVHLSSEGRAWRSTALLSLPFGGVPQDILYLRHDDGMILDAQDFSPVGLVRDLVDTARTDELDGVGRELR